MRDSTAKLAYSSSVYASTPRLLTRFLWKRASPLGAEAKARVPQEPQVMCGTP